MSTVDHSAGSGTPDFNALATSSTYTAGHWRLAWDELGEPRAWPLLRDLVRTGAQPVGAARALRASLVLPVEREANACHQAGDDYRAGRIRTLLTGRSPGCLPFCRGGLHEADCPNLTTVTSPGGPNA